MMPTPIEVLQIAIFAGVTRDRYSHKKGGGRAPGKVIEGLSDELRESLKGLTSDQLAQIRVDPWEVSR